MLKKSLQAIVALCFMGSSVQAQCPTPSAGPDQSICAGTDLTFAATLPASFIGTWTKENEGFFGFGADQGTITDEANASSTVTDLDDGGVQLFIWTLDDGASCNVSDTMVVTVQESPTATDAGNDFEMCAGGTATLNATDAPVGSIGVWTIRIGVNAGTTTVSDVNNSQSEVTGFNTTGNDTLRWTVTNTMCGGSAFADVAITVNGLPSTALAGGDQQACQDDTLQLVGNIATSGTSSWQVVSGGSNYFIQSAGGDTADISGNGGDIILAYKISNGANASVLNGCLSVDTVVVNFGPSLANAGVDQNTCSSSVTMAAAAPEAGETGLWTIVKQIGSEVITTPSSPTTTVTGVTSDTLTLRWTLTSGVCTDADDVDVILLGGAPSTAIAGSDVVGCEGETVELVGSMPTSGSPEWTYPEGGIFSGFTELSFTTDELNDSVSVDLIGEGTYVLYYTISVGGSTEGSCISSDSLTITINATPNASAGNDQSSCSGASAFTVTGNVGAGETGTWSVVSGSGSVSQTDTIIGSVTGVTAGETVLAWTLSNGLCSDVDELTVSVGAPSTAVVGNNITGCVDDVVQLIGSVATSGVPEWTLPNGNALSGFTELSFDPNADNETVSATLIGEGIYLVYYTISIGAANIGDACTSVDSLTITVEDCAVGIEENEAVELSVDVQPNPASDNVTISLNDSEAEVSVISIVSTDGSAVLTENIGPVSSINETLDISGLSSGVYIVKVLKGAAIYTSVLVVQ